jgi:hypothetical protein
MGKAPPFLSLLQRLKRYSPYNCIIGDSKGVVKQKMTKNKDFTNSAKNSTTKIRETVYITAKTAKRPCCGRRT